MILKLQIILLMLVDLKLQFQVEYVFRFFQYD